MNNQKLTKTKTKMIVITKITARGHFDMLKPTLNWTEFQRNW